MPTAEGSFPEGFFMKFRSGIDHAFSKNLHVMGDSGCTTQVVAEPIAQELNLVTYDYRKTRIKTANNQIILSTRRVQVEMEHREKGRHIIRFIAVVIPNLTSWPSHVPQNRPFWLSDIAHVLADPIIANPNEHTVHYSFIVGRAVMNQLKVTTKWFDGCFSLQHSTAGYIPSGIWTEECKDECPPFLLPEIRRMNSYFNSALADPEKDIFDVKTFELINEEMCRVNSGLTPEEEKLLQEIKRELDQTKLDLFGDDAASNEVKNKKTFDGYVKLIKRKPDGRLIAPLPKRPNTYPDFVDENLETGKRRIKRVERMLEKGDEYAQAYTAFIMQWAESGVMRKVTLEELRAHGKWTELPHHGVVRDSETTPVRPVIEGNAHDKGCHSSNDFLDIGVNVLPLIPEIITDMRLKKYFIMSDISKAFVQIELAEEDQWLLVIRWPSHKLPDGTWHHDFYCFTRLPWGISPAPFVLNAGTRCLFRAEGEENPVLTPITSQLEKNAYVDDIASTGNTKQETVEMAKVAVRALAKGQMELTKHRGFPAEIVEALGAKPTYKPYKILGSGYDPSDDTMFLTLENLQEFEKFTRINKRQAAGMVARVYDPLGWATPVSLRAKILRQKIDREHPKAEWNFLLSKEHTKEWHDFVEDAIKLRNFKIPRCMTVENEVKKSYHVFTDASSIAIGAVIYCISEDQSGHKRISIVTAKSKINPVARQKKVKKKDARTLQINKDGVVELTQEATPLQINRMELNAALFGTRLLDTVKSRLGESNEVHFWTDSMVTLQWITKGPYTGVEFIDSRIRKIHAASKAEQWQHCAGTDNPADLASRGCKADELINSEIWLKGPKWLADQSSWPHVTLSLRPIIETDSQKEESLRDMFTRKIFQVMNSDGVSRTDHKWEKSVRRYAAIIRFQRRIREKQNMPTAGYNLRSLKKDKFVFKKENSYFKLTNRFEKHELNMAEIYLLRDMQRIYAPKLWKQLSKHQDDVVDGLTWSKGPCQKLQLIVSCGRQYNTKRPTGSIVERPLIYIPGTTGSLDHPKINPVAKMLMIQAHHDSGHGAAIPALAAFRRRYWVSHGRKLAVWARKHCPICLKHDSRIVQAPLGKLPDYRYTGNEMFRTMGIDFVGPLKPLEKTKEKTWICVFSCPLTRAIIMRPVTSVSARTFAATLNEVINEHALEPELIISDRAQTFRCVYRSTLVQAKKDLEDQFSPIKCQFNASRAPWWGGFFERMMGVIKDKVSRCFNNNAWHKLDQLRAATAQVQRIINSRPLTWISAAKEDACHPVTPLMYLSPHSKWNYFGPFDPFSYGPNEPRFVSTTPKDAIRDHEYLKKLYKTMWVHFHDAYLAELRKMRQSNVKPNDCLLREKQVVLFRPVSTGFAKKTFKSPAKWRMARIVKLHPSPYDGRVRAVDLEFYDGDIKKYTTLESQSIQNIAPFELDLTTAIELSEKHLKERKRNENPFSMRKVMQKNVIETQWFSFAQAG